MVWIEQREYPYRRLSADLFPCSQEKEKTDVLVLGNGTGTFAAQCRKFFSRSQVEGVEIDEKITALAKDYFQMPDDVKVTTYDGRAYLNAIDKTYDVILVDAFQDITIPFQMSSVEFFRLVKSHLKEDGVMAVNLNMRGDGGGVSMNICLIQ